MEERTKLYELLYLVPNKYTEDELPTITQKVKDLIAKQDGEVKKEVNYGKRRLAYPIKHNHYGYYLLNHFVMPSANLKKLENTLRVQDELLRHLVTVAIPEGAVPEGGDLRQVEQAQPKKEEEKGSRKKPTIADTRATDDEKKKMAKGTAFDIEKELGVTAAEAEKALEEEGKDKAKRDESVDLKELDTKLDEIMKDLE